MTLPKTFTESAPTGIVQGVLKELEAVHRARGRAETLALVKEMKEGGRERSVGQVNSTGRRGGGGVWSLGLL